MTLTNNLCYHGSMKKWQKRLIFYGWLVLLIIIASQLLAVYWWVAELFSHFSFFAAVLLLFVALLIRHRSRYVFVLFSLPLIVWGLLPLSYWFSPTLSKPTEKLLLYNVKINNPKPTAEIDRIKASKAEILILIEAGGQWQSALQSLNTAYPHGCGHEEDSPFALHVLAKKPLKSCQISYLDGLPYARLETLKQRVIYALHPPPPITAELADQRQHYLSEAGKNIRHETYPTLVVGDFNHTAFSPLFRQFLQQADLLPLTYRALPTWKPFFLPLDHALGRNLAKQSVQVKPLQWQYSDHRPLLLQW